MRKDTSFSTAALITALPPMQSLLKSLRYWLMQREGDLRNLIPVVSFEIYLALHFLITWPVVCFKISLLAIGGLRLRLGFFPLGGEV